MDIRFGRPELFLAQVSCAGGVGRVVEGGHDCLTGSGVQTALLVTALILAGRVPCLGGVGRVVEGGLVR